MSVGGVLRSGIVIASAALAGGAAAAPASIDYRRQWLAETRLVHGEALRMCRTLRGQGERSGQLAFRSAAPSCADYYVNAHEIAATLEDIRVFLPLPGLGFDRACYQAGWLYGFVRAHEALWPICEAELGEARREALSARLTACREVAEVIAADSESLVDFLRANNDLPEDAALAALRQKMVALVYVGRSQEAWKALLASERDTDFSSLPCQVAIGLTLAEGR